MAAHRPDRPCQATISANHGSSALAKLTIEKERPSVQATSIAASAMPTIGKSNSSRAPPRPGSPKAAQTAASKVPRFSASISSMTALPIAASARVAMYGTPRGAVIGISSVPALATSRPDATSRSVTPVEVLGLAIRIFIVVTSLPSVVSTESE